MFPLIIYRRTSIERDTEVPIKKIQGENPQIFRTFRSNNRFVEDTRIQTRESVSESDMNVIIPNYVRITYSLNI